MIRQVGKKSGFKYVTKLGKSTYQIRFDIEEEEDSSLISYTEEVVQAPLTTFKIRSLVESYYNNLVQDKIQKGYTYNGHQVWLSQENQSNYKAAYELSRLNPEAILPYKIKLGTDRNPVYHTFTDVEELSTFWEGAVNHIQSCLEWVWEKKDGIDYTVYTREKDL